MDKVSVIIPTYQREVKYLNRAIQSVLNQDYGNIEVVVVDDNKADSYFRKSIQEFMEKLSDETKVVYVANKKNMGGALARNEGIGAATGQYISFLDDDDKYLEHKVKNQIEFMKKNNLDMSFTELKLVNNKGDIVDYREFRNVKNFNNKELLKYHMLYHLTGTPTFMYKADKLREIGGFSDAKMGQEFYLMTKTIENNLRIGYLPKCDVIAYRHDEGGISQGANKIKGENNLYKFKKQYFHLFTASEKRYIKFRHFAVLAVAYKRNKQFGKMIEYLVKMFFVAPIVCLQEVCKMGFKLVKYKR